MLELDFMRLAFAVGIVVGVLAPAVGFFLVERRQSLVGDGLGHVAFAGVAAGYLLGISPVLTALCFAVVGAFAIEWLRSRGGTAGDQALALVFYTGIALGIVLVSKANRLDAGLFQFLFGSILTVTRDDLWVVLALGGVSLAAIALLYRGLVAVVLDEEGSRVAGAPVGLLNTAVAVLAALTVGISMRIVGILLIAALMVLPVIAAQRVAWSLRSTLGLATADLGQVDEGIGIRDPNYLTAELDSRTAEITLLGGYRAVKTETLTMDFLAGGRMNWFSTGLQLEGPNRSIEGKVKQNWLDPLIGMRTHAALGGKWGLSVYGDVGGILWGSDITWQGVGTVDYQINQKMAVGVGYRHWKVNYDDGDFLYNVKQSGPLIVFRSRL